MADNNPLSFVSSLTNVLPSMELEPQVKKKKRWLSWLLAGLGAIISGISVLTTGCVPIAMMVVAGLTVVAGTAAMVFGINEAADYYTEKNFLKEKCGWSQTTYDKVATGVEIAAVVGAVVCEIYSFSRLARGAQCFKAGTQVLTESGKKNIEEINAGDKVWAYDEETGERALKEVVQLFRNKTDRWYKVDVEGQEPLKCTGEHPFYVLNTTADRPVVTFEGREESSFEGQWVAAKDLKVGDKCLLADGKKAIIKALDVEHLAEPETTYNFEVADFHTYYVGEQGILVHNDCPYQYLDEALQRQGLDKVPEGGFKETWVRDGYTIEVRAHTANSQYTNAKQIFRVSRQPIYSGTGQGAGTSYLATNGVWYHTSVLKPTSLTYNAWAAANTHIPIW